MEWTHRQSWCCSVKYKLIWRAACTKRADCTRFEGLTVVLLKIQVLWEDERNTPVKNFGHYLPVDTASHSKRLESSVLCLYFSDPKPVLRSRCQVLVANKNCKDCIPIDLCVLQWLSPRTLHSFTNSTHMYVSSETNVCLKPIIIRILNGSLTFWIIMVAYPKYWHISDTLSHITVQ